MKWREIGPHLRELWQRPAGPMNWKNPIRVFAVLGWLVVQGFVLLGWAGWRVFQGFMLLGWTVFRVVQFVVGLPPLLLFFFGGLWYAVWSFVRRPFPSFDEHPILALVQYHTPDVFTTMLVWYYLSPFVVVMLCGVISVTVWKVWLEGRRRDFAPFAKLPPWPLSADQQAPAIVIGEVHHPIEAREIFSPSWLTIPERGLYTGVAIFGAVGSGKTSACMNPFARQLLGWQAGNPHLRAAALVLEVKGDFCHDIRQILVEAGRGEDYIELGMDSRSQWNPLSAWWLDSYSLAYTISSLLNQLFGKGKEPFWQQAYTNLVRWIIELHRVFPERWVTLQQVYRCAIDPDLFASKIEAAQKLSDDLNTGTIFVETGALTPQLTHLEEWDWTPTPRSQQHQAVHTRPLKAKLEELKITHEIVWQSGPGKDTRERVEAINRWFVHDWQNLDNKIKSSIVEGVSVFLSMFDMPDVARVFCPPAPHTTDDPQAIILQAQIKRLQAEKEAAAAKAAEPEPEPEAEPQPEAEAAAEPEPEPEAEPQPEAEATAEAAEAAEAEPEPEPDDKTPQAAEIRYTWGGDPKARKNPKTPKKPETAAEAAEPEPDDKPPQEAEPEQVKAKEAAWIVTEAQPEDKTPHTPDPSTESNQAPTQEEAPVTRHLPPIYQLIEQGKVLALNMPAGINPALSRAVGVMLKNAWLQALLMRPAQMKANPGSYFRPAVFICDEYQAFASVGEEDPSGDEKSFALTRQCRCIPIVATQSISSLRAVLGSSEAWRSLLQTLRTRIFLSLSDDASAKIASELCGQVAKIKESYTISETSKRSEVSPLSGRAGGGGGSMGATKSFREQREAVFHPRDFALLSNCQAICLPYDGAQSLEPRRVYLKPHYLPAEHSYWRAKEAGQI